MKHHVIPWIIGLVLWLIRRSCRLKGHADVRPDLRSQGNSYIFATLHAHQIGAGMFADRHTGAMVSRSRDGGMVVPTLKLFGVRPIRGSGGKSRKGGAAAMTRLIRHVSDGYAACLAVDGPKGPRGHVYGGVAMLARKTGQPVLAVTVVPSRRWIIKSSWDRLQIPQPFCRIDGYLSQPLWIGENESLEAFADRIETTLRTMEQRCDPEEAKAAQPSDMKSRESVAAVPQNRAA